MTRKILSACLLLVLLTTLAAAQPSGYFISARNAEHLADEAGLRSRVAFLADSVCAGRAAGTPGSLHAQSAIARQFAAYGLLPAGGSYFHGFHTLSGGPAHNVVGSSPAAETATWSSPRTMTTSARFPAPCIPGRTATPPASRR